MEYELYTNGCRYKVGDINPGSVVVVAQSNKDIHANAPIYMVTDCPLVDADSESRDREQRLVVNLSNGATAMLDREQRLVVNLSNGTTAMLGRDTHVMILKQVHKATYTTEALIPSGGPHVK